MDIRKSIIEEIRIFVAEENEACSMGAVWQEPMVGFADAKSEYIGRLREIVHPDHQMPEEVMADNFSYAIMFGVNGAKYNSPEIIQAICDYLKK